MRILRIVVAAALAAATAVAGLASFAAPASADVPASNPIQYVTQYFWGGSTSFAVSGTVSCPSGSRVVSSGASASGGGGQLTAIAPDINSFTSATATAFAPGYLQITVGCEAAAAMSEVTTRTIQLPYGSGFRRGVVYCQRACTPSVAAATWSSLSASAGSRETACRWCPTRSPRTAPAGPSQRPRTTPTTRPSSPPSA